MENTKTKAKTGTKTAKKTANKPTARKTTTTKPKTTTKATTKSAVTKAKTTKTKPATKEEKETLTTISEDVIFDEFILDKTRIVVLDNEKIKDLLNVGDDDLVLAKLIPVAKKVDEYTMEPLTESEYDRASRKYKLLLKMAEEEE